jgi:hypothetical protein
MDFLGAIKLLTFRAKLALPLIYAEHIIHKFTFTEDQTIILNAGFEACWKWIKDQSISAYDIYETIPPILMLTTKPQNNKKRLSAISAAISAIYYVTWKADSYEFTRLGIDNRSKYGGDLFEITVKTALEAKNYAVRAADDSKEEFLWQQEKLSFFLTHHKALITGEMGSEISREALLR